MARIELVSKKGSIVSSYSDTVIFHNGKGTDSNGKPYGIIKSSYSDPFGLIFDSSTLELTLKPGMLTIYGRQIELTEEKLIFDFHSITTSAKQYCLIYIELDLTDFLNQKVSIKLERSARDYWNPTIYGKQDNLYKLESGVYCAPLRKFIYNPNAETVSELFVDEGLAMNILPDEARFATTQLKEDSKINNILISSLVEYDQTNKNYKFKKASNADALSKYTSNKKFGDNVPGYSVAGEAIKFGDNDNKTEVSPTLTGLYTVARNTILSISSIGKSVWNKTITIKCDINHLKAIRIFFDKASFSTQFIKMRLGLNTFWSGYGVDRTVDITCDLVNSEMWRMGSFVPFTLCFWAKHYEYSGYRENAFMITTLAEYENPTGNYRSLPEDIFSGNSGSDVYGSWGKRKYGTASFTANASNKTLTIQITSYGNGPEWNDDWWGLGAAKAYLAALADTADRGNMLIDCIYEGDVKL